MVRATSSSCKMLPSTRYFYICCDWRKFVDPSGLWIAQIVCMQLVLTACAVNRIMEAFSRSFCHEDPTFLLRWAQVVLYFLIRFMEYAALDGRRLQARTSALFYKVRIVCFISSFHKPVDFSWRCTMTSFSESTSYASRGLEPTPLYVRGACTVNHFV